MDVVEYVYLDGFVFYVVGFGDSVDVLDEFYIVRV